MKFSAPAASAPVLVKSYSLGEGIGGQSRWSVLTLGDLNCLNSVNIPYVLAYPVVLWWTPVVVANSASMRFDRSCAPKYAARRYYSSSPATL